MLRATAICLLCAALPCAAARYTVTPETLGLIAEHGPGHEYVLGDGIYSEILVRTPFDATEQQPTILRAANAGRAVVRPTSPQTNGLCAADIVRPQWLVVDGLTVINAGVDGIRFVGASHVVIRNCLVTGCQGQGIALHDASDVLVEDCCLTANGRGQDNQRHGLYASGHRITIRRCRVWQNSGYGLHLWEDASACVLADNLCWSNGRAGIVVQAVADATPEDGNLIARNQLFSNAIGLQLSRGAHDRIIDNEIRSNPEASITFQRETVAHVFLSGNRVDMPPAGMNGKQVVASQPEGAAR